MAPFSSMIGSSSAVSLAMASFAPSKASAAMPAGGDYKTAVTSSVVAHAAAEGGKIKMYSNEFYGICGLGG